MKLHVNANDFYSILVYDTNHMARERWNNFTEGIVEQIHAKKRKQMQEAIDQKVLVLQEKLIDQRDVNFFGNPDDGYTASVAVSPANDQNQKYGIIATLYVRPLTSEEMRDALRLNEDTGGFLAFYKLPISASVGIREQGNVEGRFNTDIFTSASKFSNSATSIYPEHEAPNILHFMTSPLDKINLNYLQGIETVLSTVMGKAGI